MGCWKVLDFCQ